jgi:hypothetical protein
MNAVIAIIITATTTFLGDVLDVWHFRGKTGKP